MKKLLFTISIAVIASLNILAQGYRNPVLPGFHADPSVCVCVYKRKGLLPCQQHVPVFSRSTCVSQQRPDTLGTGR